MVPTIGVVGGTPVFCAIGDGDREGGHASHPDGPTGRRNRSGVVPIAVNAVIGDGAAS